MKSGKPRILIVDDEPIICETFSEALSGPYELVTALSGPDALAILLSEDFDLILCDSMMPQMAGSEVYFQSVEKRPELASRFIFITAARLPAELQAAGVRHLQKPFSLSVIRVAVREALAGESA